MFVVLISVSLFGIVFGVIQAAMDPENHKCRFAIVFEVTREIDKCKPLGILFGCIFATLIEILRQCEVSNRPKGKNALEPKLAGDKQRYNSDIDTPCCEYDEDEEKISLI